MPKGGEKFGAWYDYAAAEAAVQFFPSYLILTDAEWYGKPFVLSPYQEKIVRTTFGWKRADGTRLIRQVYIEIPRKNGKTEFAAGLALLVMVADGEFGGQAYSMATDKEQAKLVFNKAVTMASRSPALASDLEFYKTSIYCPSLMASFRPLSSKSATKDGFSPSFAIADEVHKWPHGELFDVVHKGTGARRQPLEVLITTAGRPGEGFGWEMHEYAEQVIKGEIEDATFYAVIYSADPSDDWRAPETWEKANPNLGTSIKRAYLEEEVTKAQGNARRIAEFKRYHLNIWNENIVAGLNVEQWEACPVTPVTLESLRGRRCIGALDLSTTTDLTALCIAAEKVGQPGYDAWWRFWLPSADLKERVRRDRVPYDRWIAEGYITATEGNVVDYDIIRAQLTGAVQHPLVSGTPILQEINLAELAIDRWNATQIVTQLMGDGVNVVQFGQGFASMSAPSKELERLLGLHALNHGNNPVARWMAGCTSFVADAAENIKPVKPERRKSIKRIDGIVALIMALGRFIAIPKEPPPPAPGIMFV